MNSYENRLTKALFEATMLARRRSLRFEKCSPKAKRRFAKHSSRIFTRYYAASGYIKAKILAINIALLAKYRNNYLWSRHCYWRSRSSTSSPKVMDGSYKGMTYFRKSIIETILSGLGCALHQPSSRFGLHSKRASRHGVNYCSVEFSYSNFTDWSCRRVGCWKHRRLKTVRRGEAHRRTIGQAHSQISESENCPSCLRRRPTNEVNLFTFELIFRGLASF